MTCRYWFVVNNVDLQPIPFLLFRSRHNCRHSCRPTIGCSSLATRPTLEADLLTNGLQVCVGCYFLRLNIVEDVIFDAHNNTRVIAITADAAIDLI